MPCSRCLSSRPESRPTCRHRSWPLSSATRFFIGRTCSMPPRIHRPQIETRHRRASLRGPTPGTHLPSQMYRTCRNRDQQSYTTTMRRSRRSKTKWLRASKTRTKSPSRCKRPDKQTPTAMSECRDLESPRALPRIRESHLGMAVGPSLSVVQPLRTTITTSSNKPGRRLKTSGSARRRIDGDCSRGKPLKWTKPRRPEQPVNWPPSKGMKQKRGRTRKSRSSSRRRTPSRSATSRCATTR